MNIWSKDSMLRFVYSVVFLLFFSKLDEWELSYTYQQSH